MLNWESAGENTMTVSTGSKLGPYEILAPVGAGGMGEVWRARDTRLNREVAIKVLPASFANDADRLLRFEQEALATSALSHPNILAIYDIGRHQGSPYMVIELLEGEELRACLNSGPVAVRSCVDYALQIAQGLSVAHEKGIVHRDLKPENLFVTKDGRVKILDFGLAKLKPSRQADGDSEVATMKLITEPGVVMGTASYMSPEQIRGLEVDHRSDIFAFGLIFYEMLAGKPAFTGNSIADLMSAVLKEEPEELSDTNPSISIALEKIVRRCLDKKRERRFQSTSDLCFAIEALTTASGSRLEPVAAPTLMTERSGKTPLSGNPRLAWAVAAGLLLVVLAFGWVWFTRKPTTDASVVRFSLFPPESTNFLSSGREASPPAISADGRRLAFVATMADGKRQLWVRALDSLLAQPLAGTEGASHPFWSPDGRYVGFFANGKLNKVEAAGGAVLTLCDAPGGFGGSWNRDGVIIFAPSNTSPVFEVPASGGTPNPVTELDEVQGAVSHYWPCFLPDGRHFVFLSRGFVTGASDRDTINIGSLDSKENRPLFQASSSISYAAGHLLFHREGLLLAQPFDLKGLKTVGEAFPILKRVQYQITSSRGIFAVSENGVLVYQPGTEAGAFQLTWLDRTGKSLGVLGDPANYVTPNPSFSPDGTRVAVQMQTAAQSVMSDIWIYEIARGLPTRFTFDPASERAPLWSPDGSRIVFGSTRKGKVDLYQKAANGTGDEEMLLESEFDKYPMSWSRDGRFILYQEIAPRVGGDLWVLPLEGERKPFPFLQTNSNELVPSFSPDARWVAYESDESGRMEIYVAPFPGPGGKRQVSLAGGVFPRWRGDGKELYYLAANNHLMVTEVNGTGSAFEVGAARPLFEARQTGPGYFYAVTPDDQRFLVNKVIEEKGTSQMILVLNWTPDSMR
jgi:eukaryotic-like serine/threonine-protein kinase